MYDFESDVRHVATGAISRSQFIRRGLAAGLSMTFLGQVLAACGSSGDGGQGGTVSASGAPVTGKPPATPTGKLVVGDAQSPVVAGWDAASSGAGYDIRLFSLLYEPLIDLDENGRLVPVLATRWERLSPTTVRVTLRDGVRFHDGSPLTAEDVKATLDRLGAKGAALLLASYFTELHCKIRDARTVDIVCAQPFGILEDALPVARIMRAEVLADEKRLRARPIGTGPFRYVSRGNSQTVVEANPDYWQPGKPHIKTIVFETIGDQAARVNALRTGTVDVLVEAGSAQIEQFKRNGSFYIPPPRFYAPAHYMFLYSQAGPLRDVRVRQALTYAIDRQALAKSVLRGVGAVGYSPLPTTSKLYRPLEPRYEYDPEKARALLAQAGHANGLKLRQLTSSVFQVQSEADAAVTSYLRAVGIAADVERVDVGSFGSVFNRYDLVMSAGIEITGDADSSLIFFSQPLQSLIFSGNDKKMDELVRAQRTVSGAEREAAVDAAAQYIWEQQPALFLADYYFPEIVAKRVQGFTPTRSFGLVGLKDAWVA